ncbi:hypothetical protein C8A01DRAFT_46621 [Parachaetomium inaequale]|uniref:Uncharacterized protein n=1 Tax=Parachaetomium inaequale TaxID=2588326 RepID=A0AAN6SRU1_9PEZI|nr:hypothetical protein C8A01DRAFT_46621 [Parachaetomium inaequale]
MKRPFYDEAPIVGSPDCSEAAFYRPLLRRCPFEPGSISWIARLGGGLDGFAWKVMVGDQGPFVIKMFWDTEPPPGYVLYYAAQREAQNAALLEKIADAASHDTEKLPIRVHARPSDFKDAIDNLLAFSAEGRQRQQVKDADAVQISSIPRMKKCFGWLKIDGEYLLRNLPWGLRPVAVRLPKFGDRQIEPDRQHFAIMYEYIPEGDKDTGQMQQALDFLWRAGFDFSQSLRKENWKSGVLVDLSDFISPVGYCWHLSRRMDASRAFLPPPAPPPSTWRASQSDSATSSSASASPLPPASPSSSDAEDDE